MSIRKAIGAVKDRTSIRLARTSSNMAPDLEVAIVKATSHHEVPSDEKHIIQVVNLVSSGLSNGYVHSCVAAAALSKRLSKTRDWVVAVKSLLLVHRLMEGADPLFHYEIMHARTKSGSRVLDLTEFRDEAHANSWDHSKFVRTYAVYLEHKLALIMFDTNIGVAVDVGREESWRLTSPASARGHDSGYTSHINDLMIRRSRSSGDVNESAWKAVKIPLREMKLERIFTKMGLLQRLLNRALACRPNGMAKSCRLVLVATYPIVKESFQLYADICEVLEILLDKFFDMEYPDCVKVFHVYASAAKQIDELIVFYNWCIDVGVSRTSEIPDVQRINDKVLEKLKEFLLKKAKGEGSLERRDDSPAPTHEEPEPDMHDSVEKLAPDLEMPASPSVPQPEPEPLQSQLIEDLVNLNDDYETSDSQGNKFELALFADPPANGNGQWQAFQSDGLCDVTPVWQNPALAAEKTDWELVLVESASSLSIQKNSIDGGLDPLLLNGMYDQGTVRQHTSTGIYALTHDSASSMSSPQKSSKPALPLPASDGSVQAVNEDPFAASLAIPPPYVQMSDPVKNQHLLTREQELWQQYERQGMQGPDSLGRMSAQGIYGQPNPPMTPYGMNPGGYHYYSR